MEIKDIKQIIDLMKRYGLAEFELEEKDFKIRLRRDAANGNGGSSQQFVVETPMGLGVGTQPTPASPATNPPQATSSPSAPPFPHAVPPSGQAAPAAPVPDAPGVQVIKSPMVGTFYRSPTPEAKVFVDPGSPVQADTVICIIEAMKLMNEIHAEVKGTIVEVIAENGKPVEYGQPLFKVKVG